MPLSTAALDPTLVTDRPADAPSGYVRSATASIALAACLFAAQASLVTLSPILPKVADAMGVSTTVTGQLRSLSGGVAGVAALLILAYGVSQDLHRMLTAGLWVLAVGALVSALAPEFAVLAGAQVLIGLGLATVLSTALAAAATWPHPADRGRVLAWALIGQPAAWIVALPLIGALGQRSWRLAWLVPLAAAVTAAAAIGGIGGRTEPTTGAPRASLLARPGMARWALGELLAYAGWAGALVYAGALFHDRYGTSVGVTGLLLAIGAAAYVPGNFAARRLARQHTRAALVVLALAMAVAGSVLGAMRVALGWSVLVWAVFALLGGARTFVGSALGLDLAGGHRLQGMGLRTAAVQLGYLAGAALGGLGLTLAGWNGFAITLGLLMVGAALPHLFRRRIPTAGPRS